MKIRSRILEGLMLLVFIGLNDEMNAAHFPGIKNNAVDTLVVGQPAGAFFLTTPEGKELNNETLKGKIVVIDFWASWCAPCKKLTHETDSLLSAYHGKDDFQMIGVCYRESRKEAALQYWKESGYRFPMATDNDVLGKAVQAGNPTILVLDRTGIVRGRWDRYTPGTAMDIRNLVEELAGKDDENKDGPVDFTVKATSRLRTGSEGTVEVNFDFGEGWYGYAETPANIAGGWIPTKVEIIFPEGFEAVGKLQAPVSHPKAGAEVYDGKNVKFVQVFRVKPNSGNAKILSPGEYLVKVAISYQTCNEELCLPPVTKEENIKVTIF